MTQSLQCADTLFASTLPCHVFPFTIRFERPVPMTPLPVAPLRGLCEPALHWYYAGKNGRAGTDYRPALIKPESGGEARPQPYTLHCGPSQLLYNTDPGRNGSCESCETLRGSIHAFAHEPAMIDRLLEALAGFGAAAAADNRVGGWPVASKRSGFSLVRAEGGATTEPAPWSLGASEGDDAHGAWEVVLQAPYRQALKVSRHRPDAPLRRAMLHELFGPGPHSPCFFHKRHVDRHLLLYCLAMGSLRRLACLAQAAGAACHIDKAAVSAMIWKQSRVTRTAVFPRAYAYYRKTGQRLDLDGLVGRLEFEGPALIARILASGAHTGIGLRPNYGCGRIAIRPL